MLRRLSIADYQLIARAEIDFSSGATMFTGETGSGKTMVLGAIGFVLGERTGSDNIRRTASRATVTLEFEPSQELREHLVSAGFGIDDDEDATLARELSESGKSVLRLNGRPTTAGYVREIAPEVVDIVGQHEAQRLLLPGYHLELLDRFGGDMHATAGARVAALHRRAAELDSRLKALAENEKRAQERHTFAKYALEEIERAGPEAGEDERLNERRKFLDNVEKIALALRTAHEALGGDDRSASAALGAAVSELHQVANLGGALDSLAQNARTLQSEVNDLSTQIVRELDATEFNPAELEAINQRLDILDTLKRKFGGSIESVIASAEDFRNDVDAFENADERHNALTQELRAAQSDLHEASTQLSSLRRTAATRLSKAIEKELQDLALGAGRFSVQFEKLAEIGPGGAERAQFLFAANKGEEERPLARVASGGELSRVLLALVVVLAAKRGRTALVFDEVDLGIGGATATSVGVRLARLARQAQVICVTHLAQIAAWADAHYTLEKAESRGGTTITLRRIETASERAEELARMLSGEKHEVALKHARTLLQQTRERREAIA